MSEAVAWAILGLMLYSVDLFPDAFFGAFALQAATWIVARFKPVYIRAFLVVLCGYVLLLGIWLLLYQALAMAGPRPNAILIMALIPGIFLQTLLYVWLLKPRKRKQRLSYGAA